jgi:sugar phosphate permease
MGVALGGIIATHWGWRHALGIVAIPGIIVAILFFFVKDYRTVGLLKKKPASGEKEAHMVRMSLKDLFYEFIHKPSLLLTYFGMAGVVFSTTSLMTWLPTYFNRVQGIPADKAGLKSSMVMLLAIVGAPLGGYLVDRWRKKRVNARLIFPAITTLVSAVFMFLAFTVFTGEKMQYMMLLSVGISITAFISAASAVTQDVVHAGLRAISYAIAVVVQNLLGSMTAPVIIGAISDATNIQTAFNLLPVSLVIASILFFAGSFFYERDLSKVETIKMEVA